MKRKFIFVATFIVFFFFSCATNKDIKSDVPETPKVENTENASPNENEDVSKKTQDESESEDKNDNENEAPSEKDAVSESEFDFSNAEIIPEDEAYFLSEEEKDEDVVEEEPPVVVTEKDVIQPETPVAVEKNEAKTESKNVQNPRLDEEKEKNETTLTENSGSAQIAEGEVDVEKQEDEESDEIEEKPPIIPSRTVTIQKGQYLDVQYPGSGWVYLGEIDEEGTDEKKLTYFGRKLGGDNTTFTLRSRNEGEAILHFYKNDNLTRTYIDDYLAVIVENKVAPSTTTRTTAPSYAEVVPKKPEKVVKEKPAKNEENSKDVAAKKDVPENKKSTSSSLASSSVSSSKNESPQKGTTIVQTSESEPAYNSPTVQSPNQARPTDSTPQVSPSKAASSPAPSALPEKEDELFEYAQKCYDEKKYPESLEAIQKYLDISGSRTDEAIYLQGLNFEADSPVRNIRNAIDCFDSVVKKYPESTVWQKSRNRSIYLKRFYVEIR